MNYLKTGQAFVEFYEEDIFVVEDGGQLFVAINPICSALGISFEAQRKTLLRRGGRLPTLACTGDNSTELLKPFPLSDIKSRYFVSYQGDPVLMLPVSSLSRWFNSIDPSSLIDYWCWMLLKRYKENFMNSLHAQLEAQLSASNSDS